MSNRDNEVGLMLFGFFIMLAVPTVGVATFLMLPGYETVLRLLAAFGAMFATWICCRVVGVIGGTMLE